MLINDIVENDDQEPSSLAAVLFQCLRNASYKYEEEQIVRSASLRKTINAEALASVKKLMPNVTDAQWNKASEILLNRMS